MCKHLYIVFGMLLCSSSIYTMDTIDDWDDADKALPNLQEKKHDWTLYDKDGQEEPSTPPLTMATVDASRTSLTPSPVPPAAPMPSSLIAVTSLASDHGGKLSIFKPIRSDVSPLLRAAAAVLSRSASAAKLSSPNVSPLTKAAAPAVLPRAASPARLPSGSSVAHKHAVSAYFIREQRDPFLEIPIQRLDAATSQTQNTEGDMSTESFEDFVTDLLMPLVPLFLSLKDGADEASIN